jgi:(p)ppGpp synthase/HD superfamily hydrolase
MNIETRLSQAFAFAEELHKSQTRKVGPDEEPHLAVSYLTHLVEVMSLTIQGFGDEDQQIAALLHDAVEDHPECGEKQRTEDVIRELFGERVSHLVDLCTDARPAVAGEAKAPWFDRKREHISHLREEGYKDPTVLLVPLADKLSNGQAIVNDVLLHGDVVWDRFNAKPHQTKWYYTSMLSVFQELIPDNPLVPRLERVVAQLQDLCNKSKTATTDAQVNT